MSNGKIPLTKSAIRRHVGETAFLRGKTYVEKGRVMLAEQKGDFVYGKVRGSVAEPYDSEIILGEDGEILSSYCSCPIGSECKHIAALGLALLRAVINKAVPMPQKNISPIPDWQKTLDDITLGQSADDEAEKNLPRNHFARKELDERVPHEVELMFRFAQSDVRTQKQGDNKTFMLEVRPRFRNTKTGKSSLTLFKWKNFSPYHSHAYYYADPIDGVLSPESRQYLEVLCEQLESGTRYARGDETWLPFPGSRAPIMWQLLKQHDKFGVTLCFGEKASVGVATRTDAVVPTLTISDDQSGLSLGKELFIGTQKLADTYADPIAILYGDPPVFAFVTGLEEQPGQGQTLTFSFFPVEGKIDFPLLISLERPLHIPLKDTADFIARYAPALAKKNTLRNFSTTAIIPLVGKPKMGIAITKAGAYAIDVALSWRYGAHATKLSSSVSSIGSPDAPILRDKEAEREILRALDAAHLRRFHDMDDQGRPHDTTRIEKKDAAQFMNSVLPSLQQNFAAHLDVLRANEVPQFTIIHDDPKAEFHIGDGSTGSSDKSGDAEKAPQEDAGSDWFNLSMQITVAGKAVRIGDAMTAIQTGEPYLFLEDGSMVDLAHPFFRKWKVLMDEAAHLADPQSQQITLSRFHAGWWEELKTLGIVGAQSARWEESVGSLLSIDHVPKITKTPVSINATLRPYQKDGLSWLVFLHAQELGGVLADDMGLGKTVQSIAFMCHVREEAVRSAKLKNTPRTGKASKQQGHKPFLIIAPTSVVENWDSELARFAASLDRIVLRQGDRSAAHARMQHADVVVTSYALLRRDEDELKTITWETIIIDEAQAIKNHQSQTYGLVRKLKTGSRIALTGTPMENNTMELWSLFSVVAPGLFPPPERFVEVFRNPIEKEASKEALAQLRRRVRPFLLRRKREIVATELPPKTEQIISIEMGPAQRKLYDLHLEKQRQRVLGLLSEGGMKAHRFEILTALTRMRQLCLAPSLVDTKHMHIPSAKREALLEHLETILAEEHKVIVFSQFTGFLAVIREALDSKKLRYSYLDGSTKNRKEAIAEFQTNPKTNVFLVSLKAGGVGLNLTAADYCIMLDPWWNPAVEHQAVARAHRIGQKRNVTVYKFIAKDSIEEKVLKLQEKKQALFANVINDGDAFGAMITDSDIKNLFAK